MPGYRIHIAVGVSSCLAALYTVKVLNLASATFLEVVGCLAVAVIGSIFPDIDTTSKMQRIFFTFSSIAILCSIFFQAWFFFFNLSFITVVVTLLKHRTLTHRVWFIFALSIISVLLSSFLFHEISYTSILIASCFAISAFSHIIIDFWI